MNPMLKKVLGEGGRSDSIIPNDAQELDRASDVVGKPLNPIVRVVQEPGRPTGDKEKLMTPYSALTAPDCTPGALTPIDPSKVPGAQGPETFTAQDLDQADEVPETGLGMQDKGVKTMDILLGRRRTGAPAKNQAEMSAAGKVQTEEGAAAMLGIRTPLMEEAEAKAKAFAASASTPGMGGMPDPTPQGDGRNVYSAFRRATS